MCKIGCIKIISNETIEKLIGKSIDEVATSTIFRFVFRCKRTMVLVKKTHNFFAVIVSNDDNAQR